MAIKTYTLNSYEISLGYKISGIAGITYQIQGRLVCRSSDGYSFAVYGLHPTSPVPGPFYNPATRVGAIYIPFVELQYYIDLVRNEKPITVLMNSVSPQFNQLYTGAEPVGEEEGI